MLFRSVAFAALTDGGARVYENEEGKLQVALTVGSSCGAGKISYISQDRVGLNSDGSITVAGSCSGTPALFLISNSHPTMLVGTGSGRANSAFIDLEMPRLFDDGSIMFSASTRAGGEGLYSIRPGSGTANPSGPALPLLSASTSSVEPLHSVLVVSVASNEHGLLAYLGGPVESVARQNLATFLSRTTSALFHRSAAVTRKRRHKSWTVTGPSGESNWCWISVPCAGALRTMHTLHVLITRSG